MLYIEAEVTLTQNTKLYRVGIIPGGDRVHIFLSTAALVGLILTFSCHGDVRNLVSRNNYRPRNALIRQIRFH